MKSKKILAMLIAAAMTTSCLAGCGQQAGTNKESEKASESKVEESKAESSSVVDEEASLFNVEGQLPIVNEPITLKVLAVDDPRHPMGHTQDSLIWDWLTEQTGIQFEVETYMSEDLATKLPLIMAGDDLPDIFTECGFSYGDLETYANAGKILPLNDLIEEYGYYTKQAMEERPDAVPAFYASDGNCYGLPRITIRDTPCIYGINQEWLDNLGLEVPTSFEELYDVLVAFKEKDANGNGDPNDEIPWSMSPGNMNTIRWLLSTVGIAGYWPISGAIFDDKDGDVFMVNTSDQYRELLTFMNKCYEDGLLIQEAFTQSSAEHGALYEANRVGLLNQVGTHDLTEKACGKVLTYTGLVIGLGDYEPVHGIGPSFNPNLFSISATTEYPEICFLLGDYLYSQEASWMTSYGKEGESFTWTDEENLQFTAGTNNYSLFTNVYLPEEWEQEVKDDVTRVYREKAYEVGKSAWQHILVFTEEEADQISVLGTDLATVVDEWYVHFVTGQKDIEKDWDEYVKLVESLNAEELTEIYQGAYDRFMSH